MKFCWKREQVRVHRHHHLAASVRKREASLRPLLPGHCEVEYIRVVRAMASLFQVGSTNEDRSARQCTLHELCEPTTVYKEIRAYPTVTLATVTCDSCDCRFDIRVVDDAVYCDNENGETWQLLGKK